MSVETRRDEIVELSHGRFIDVKKGEYYPRELRVLIQGEKIIAMPGLPGEPDHIIPDRTIDVQGKTVHPGLFNTHCHIQMVLPTVLVGMQQLRTIQQYSRNQIRMNMQSCLEHGITSIRDTWTPDLEINHKLHEEIGSGRIPGPRSFQSVMVSMVGGAATPIPTLMDRIAVAVSRFFFPQRRITKPGEVLFKKDASEKVVREAVDIAIDQCGAEAIKLYEQPVTMLTYRPGVLDMPEKQMSALADQARKRGIKTTIHAVTVNTFRRAVRAGVASLAHLPLDGVLTDQDITLFNQAGSILEPTLSVAYMICHPIPIPGNECYRHPEMTRLQAFREENHRKLDQEYWLPEFQPILKDGYTALQKGRLKLLGLMDFSKPFAFYSCMVSNGFENLRKIVQADGIVAFGNDGGIPGSTPAMLELEAQLFQHVFVAGGGSLKGSAVLRIATINSAKALGVDDRLGTLETGKIADLVVVDGDPLVNPGLIGSRALAVFKAGKMVVGSCGNV